MSGDGRYRTGVPKEPLNVVPVAQRSDAVVMVRISVSRH